MPLKFLPRICTNPACPEIFDCDGDLQAHLELSSKCRCSNVDGDAIDENFTSIFSEPFLSDENGLIFYTTHGQHFGPEIPSSFLPEGNLSEETNDSSTYIVEDEFAEFLDYCQTYSVDPDLSTAAGEYGGGGIDVDILQSSPNVTHLHNELGDSDIDTEGGGGSVWDNTLVYNLEEHGDIGFDWTSYILQDHAIFSPYPEFIMSFHEHNDEVSEPDSGINSYPEFFPDISEANVIVLPDRVEEIMKNPLPNELDASTGQPSLLSQSSTNDAPPMSNTFTVVTNPVPYSKCPDCKKRKKRCRLHVTSDKKERRVSPGKACVWCKKSNKRCLGNVPCSLCDQLGRTCLGNNTQSTSIITNLCNKLDDADENNRKTALKSLLQNVSGANGCHDRYNFNPYLEILKVHGGIRKINSVLNREHWLFRYECGSVISYFRNLKDSIDVAIDSIDPSSLPTSMSATL